MMEATLLSGCGSVPVNDHEFCADKAGRGAHCAHVLTQETEDIPYAVWVKRRFGQVCTNDEPDDLGATFADIKRTIEQACSKCNCCTYNQKKTANSFFKRLLGQ